MQEYVKAFSSIFTVSSQNGTPITPFGTGGTIIFTPLSVNSTVTIEVILKAYTTSTNASAGLYVNGLNFDNTAIPQGAGNVPTTVTLCYSYNPNSLNPLSIVVQIASGNNATPISVNPFNPQTSMVKIRETI